VLDLLTALVTLVPLDATPVQHPVSPENQGNGFAAYILGGFFGLGLLVLAMLLISLKPKRADPRHVPQPRPRPR
jgi:hypothetical protein